MPSAGLFDLDVLTHGIAPPDGGTPHPILWQSLAQARERYHDATDSILANSTAKLFMGPITDNNTRSYVEQLLGQQLAEHHDHHAWRPKAPAQALQQLGDDRALLVSGSLPPAVVKLEPFWKTRALAGRAT